MTSGNLSDEPIAYRNDEALSGCAASPTSSSCTTARSSRAATTRWRGRRGRTVVFRRSRGYVPRPRTLRRRVARPVLAAGALLKNTFCLAAGTRRASGLTSATSRTSRPTRRYQERIDRLERLPRMSPESSRTTCTPTTCPRATRSRAVVSRRWPCSTTTRTWPARWPSTGSTARSSASRSTAPATAPTGRRGAARCWWPTTRTSRASARSGRCRSRRGHAAIRQPWRMALALLEDAFDGDPPLDAAAAVRGSRTRCRAVRDDVARA